MSSFSQLAETLIGSEIVRLGNIINERIRAGETIYNYTIGDFDPAFFPIPEELKTGIQKAYDEGYTNYPPAEGILALRQAVSGFVKEWEGLDYTPNEILIASGGRPLIYALFKTLVDPGDKVIYAVPSWNNNHYAHMNAGVHCAVTTTPEHGFMPTADELRPHLAGATLLCLCTPQNPTGTVLEAAALKEICELIVEENASRPSGQRKLYVMFDQMYALLTYGDTKHSTPVELCPPIKEYTVFIDGISKCFASTGVRVGWALGPAAVIAKMKALLSHIGAWAPMAEHMAEQVATANYLPHTSHVSTYLHKLKGGLESRLNRIYEGIIQLRSKGYSVDAIAPQAALYLTIKFDLAGLSNEAVTLSAQEDVTHYLLSEARLAVVPFYAFGAPRNSPWYRLSVGTCDEDTIPEMLHQLEAALANLQPALQNGAIHTASQESHS
jgi:aspartate aminotransferase